MKSWLEGGDGAPTDSEVWGEGKEGTSFGFHDLLQYMGMAKSGEQGKGKGKGREEEMVKSGEQGKGRGGGGEEETEEQKKKKRKKKVVEVESPKRSKGSRKK